MFKELGQLASLMRQLPNVNKMKEEMESLQQRLGEISGDGDAGGGMVKVVMSGKGELRGVSIDPSLLAASEKEILEDLLIAAHTDARVKVEAASAERMQAATAGLPIPPGLLASFKG